MTQSICPDCGRPLDEESPRCPDCTGAVEDTEDRGQSRTLALVVFILLLIGIVVSLAAAIVFFLR